MRRSKTLTLAVLAVSGVAAAPAQAAQPPLNSCAGLQAQLDTQAEVVIDGMLCTGTYGIYRDVVVRGVNGGGFARAGVGSDSSRSLTIDHDAAVTLSGLAFVGMAQAAAAPRAEAPKGPGGVSFDGYEPPAPPSTGTGTAANRADAGSGPGSLTVSNSTFTNIDDGDFGFGGALYADLGAGDGTAPLRITTSTFEGNATSGRGGGVAVEAPVDGDVRRADGDAPTPVTIADSHFTGNAAGPTDGESAGGGLYVGGYFPLFASRGQAAARAAGDVPDVILTNNDYTGNSVTAGGSGGGAAFSGVDVSSEGERYLANTVGDDGEGGGVSVETVPRRYGEGAQPALQASFTAVNDAIAGNTIASSGYGAGVYGGGPGGCDDRGRDVEPSECGTTLDLTHVTIAGNQGGPGGTAAGIGTDDGDALSVDRSIVWGNTNEPAPEEQPIERAAASDQAEIDTDGGDRSVTRSDYCEVAIANRADEAGNICEDPKLVDPTGVNGLPDVHQTAASLTIDAVGAAPALRAIATVVAGDFDRPADPRPIGRAADMGADEFKPPAVASTPGQPATGGSTPAVPAGGVLPAVASGAPKCGSKRFFRIVLRKKKGRVYKSARIWVNGKKAKVTKAKDGRPTTRIDLRRFGYQTIRIRIVTTLKNGKVLKGKRTYHPCRPSLDDGKPPKL